MYIQALKLEILNILYICKQPSIVLLENCDIKYAYTCKINDII